MQELIATKYPYYFIKEFDKSHEKKQFRKKRLVHVQSLCEYQSR